MNQRYLYPQNMKASANMWLWSLRDFAILAMAALLSVVFAALTKIVLPLALVLCFGVLTIRADDTTILDYIKYAVRYFIAQQQEYQWR